MPPQAPPELAPSSVCNWGQNCRTSSVLSLPLCFLSAFWEIPSALASSIVLALRCPQENELIALHLPTRPSLLPWSGSPAARLFKEMQKRLSGRTETVARPEGSHHALVVPRPAPHPPIAAPRRSRSEAYPSASFG